MDQFGGNALQSCRPYSGAVIWPAAAAHKATAECFNRAAPIPGRLSGMAANIRVWIAPLQLCRPYSGAVMIGVCFAVFPIIQLQSCRPYSGAVIVRKSRHRLLSEFASFNRAAPIPGRLSRRNLAERLDPVRASIVPPLFRGDYAVSIGRGNGWCQCFNCAAPIPGRLLERGYLSVAQIPVLQSCRPYSGAVMGPQVITITAAALLQSCRPYSGAVM